MNIYIYYIYNNIYVYTKTLKPIMFSCRYIYDIVCMYSMYIIYYYILLYGDIYYSMNYDVYILIDKFYIYIHTLYIYTIYTIYIYLHYIYTIYIYTIYIYTIYIYYIYYIYYTYFIHIIYIYTIYIIYILYILYPVSYSQENSLTDRRGLRGDDLRGDLLVDSAAGGADVLWTLRCLDGETERMARGSPGGGLDSYGYIIHGLSDGYDGYDGYVFIWNGMGFDVENMVVYIQ